MTLGSFVSLRSRLEDPHWVWRKNKRGQGWGGVKTETGSGCKTMKGVFQKHTHFTLKFV